MHRYLSGRIATYDLLHERSSSHTFVYVLSYIALHSASRVFSLHLSYLRMH